MRDPKYRDLKLKRKKSLREKDGMYSTQEPPKGIKLAD